MGSDDSGREDLAERPFVVCYLQSGLLCFRELCPLYSHVTESEVFRHV